MTARLLASLLLAAALLVSYRTAIEPFAYAGHVVAARWAELNTP